MASIRPRRRLAVSFFVSQIGSSIASTSTFVIELMGFSLARYHHLKPASLDKAATRWPKLQLDFMTIHASKGQQADYVIVMGLHDGNDGFPAPARESIMEEALLPPVEDFPDAEERRLMYVALTRARHRVWALFNKENPSPFVEILKNLDVPVARKP